MKLFCVYVSTSYSNGVEYVSCSVYIGGNLKKSSWKDICEQMDKMSTTEVIWNLHNFYKHGNLKGFDNPALRNYFETESKRYLFVKSVKENILEYRNNGANITDVDQMLIDIKLHAVKRYELIYKNNKVFRSWYKRTGTITSFKMEAVEYASVKRNVNKVNKVYIQEGCQLLKNAEIILYKNYHKIETTLPLNTSELYNSISTIKIDLMKDIGVFSPMFGILYHEAYLENERYSLTDLIFIYLNYINVILYLFREVDLSESIKQVLDNNLQAAKINCANDLKVLQASDNKTYEILAYYFWTTTSINMNYWASSNKRLDIDMCIDITTKINKNKNIDSIRLFKKISNYEKMEESIDKLDIIESLFNYLDKLMFKLNSKLKFESNPKNVSFKRSKDKLLKSLDITKGKQNEIYKFIELIYQNDAFILPTLKSSNILRNKSTHEFIEELDYNSLELDKLFKELKIVIISFYILVNEFIEN